MVDVNNLTIIENTDKDAIIQGLEGVGANSICVTNGTYVAPAEMVVPTTMAGFQFIKERKATAQECFVVAINSDKSMADIAAAKAAKGEDIGEVADQVTRAKALLEPVSKQFPEHQIVAIFYDEATPTELYEYLEANSPILLNTLFKFGYGTDPKAGDIEGADCFDSVCAYPFPNDARALCDDLTKRTPNRAHYEVYKLTEEFSANGQPYMNKQNQVLFALEEGEGLEAFAPKAEELTTAQAKKGFIPSAFGPR